MFRSAAPPNGAEVPAVAGPLRRRRRTGDASLATAPTAKGSIVGALKSSGQDQDGRHPEQHCVGDYRKEDNTLYRAIIVFAVAHQNGRCSNNLEMMLMVGQSPPSELELARRGLGYIFANACRLTELSGTANNCMRFLSRTIAKCGSSTHPKFLSTAKAVP